MPGRYLLVPKNSLIALPGLPAPGLTATPVGTSSVSLVASYSGPPALSTYSFYWAPNSGGPYSLLSTQISPLLTHSFLSPATTYYYRVLVNTSETPSRMTMFSGIQTATTGVAIGTVKWYPGWYAQPNLVVYRGNSGLATVKLNADLADTVGSNLKGIHVRYLWNALETTTLGGYDYTPINSHKSYIAGKTNATKLIVCVEFGQLGSTDGTFVVPAYVANDPATYGACGDGVHGGYVRNTTSNLSYANISNPNVVTRIVALVTSMGSVFNGDAQISQVIFLGEDSVDVDAGSSGVTAANYLAGLKRIADAAQAAFPNTSWSIGTNDGLSGAFGWTETNEADLVTYLASKRAALAGPDTLGLTSNASFPNFVYAQYIYTGQYSTYPDLRSTMPHFGQYQEPELDGSQFGAQGSPFTMADLFANSNRLNQSHISVNVLNGGVADFASVVKPFMQANPTQNSTYPTSYP